MPDACPEQEANLELHLDSCGSRQAKRLLTLRRFSKHIVQAQLGMLLLFVGDAGVPWELPYLWHQALATGMLSVCDPYIKTPSLFGSSLAEARKGYNSPSLNAGTGATGFDESFTAPSSKPKTMSPRSPFNKKGMYLPHVWVRGMLVYKATLETID